jgi:nucleotide-binding universal stress UspA family protein
MPSPVLLCADGSDLSLEALAAGVALLAAGTELVLVTVADDLDDTLLSGSGHAGPLMTEQEFAAEKASAADEAASIIARAQARLGLEGCPSRVLHGPAGTAICQLADELSAAAIVIGSRGRSGWKRAVLGSVSDEVVRNAPCTVLVTGPASSRE